MELIFKESSQVLSGKPAYEVEFKASSDFNIHIERKAGGRLLVYQKSVANGQYDIVDGLGYKDHKDIIDIDFSGSVYPKYIRVVSESEVTLAEVTESSDTSGGQGGIAIDNQDKVVEITENGTIELTADDGYTGLGKVQINTNVAGGSTSAPEYIGFRLFSGGMGDGFEYEFSVWNQTGTWQDAVNESRYHLEYQFIEQDGNVYVTYGDNSYIIYKTMEGSLNPSYSDPVKVTDKLESRIYFIDTDSQGM